MYRKKILYKHESAGEHSVKKKNDFKLFQLWNHKQKAWKSEPIWEITCSVISWCGCYYITLLLTNISSYLLMFARGTKCSGDASLFLVHPTLLRAVAYDVALGKGRGLLWAVSKPRMHRDWLLPWGNFNSLRCVPESPAAPIGLIILAHGWHSSSCKNSATEKSVPACRCPAAGVLVCKSVFWADRAQPEPSVCYFGKSHNAGAAAGTVGYSMVQ